ncbi:putative phosphoglycerate mutase pmu1 [Lecanora helva]
MSLREAKSYPKRFRYATVQGFFLQDEPDTDPLSFDYTRAEFGLIDRKYDTDIEFDPDRQKTQWQRFEHHLFYLNKNSEPDIHYKLLFLGRHGEGVHNVAENLYGTAAWNSHYSKLPGSPDGSKIWLDAPLTEKGVLQALTAHEFWSHMLTAGHIPPPKTYYTSPLTRCLTTASLTFSSLPLPPSCPFRPIVKELLRETNGVHTCDKRSSRTYILDNFPSFGIEPGFSEEDELWDPEIRESDSKTDERMRRFMDDVFENGGKGEEVVSFTSHSGAVASLLRVVGHREFRLATGSCMPVLVRGERIGGKAADDI